MNKILLMSSTFFSCQSDQLLLKTYIKSKQLPQKKKKKSHTSKKKKKVSN